MELTPRLCKVADLVPKGARFVDIGTDHAYLPTWLILNGVIEHAIAADLREGPLERAKDTAEKFGVSDKMDFRLCDGLSDVCAGEVDAIAIAGMGGETIAHILEGAPWTKEEGITLILQPMSSQSDLRKWLAAHGYAIKNECVVREDKTLYNILLVNAGKMEDMTEAELLAGQQNKDPLRGEYLAYLIAKVSRALEGQRSATHIDEAAIEETACILKDLIKMKEEWDSWQL